MNSADVIGYQKNGALYCLDHKPDNPEGPVFLDDGQVGDACEACHELLPGCDYSAALVYKIKGVVYEVIDQRGGLGPEGSQYAIRRTGKKGGTAWLTEPERNYETLGGATHAILLDLED